VGKESSEILKGCVRQSCACAGRRVHYIFVNKDNRTENLLETTIKMRAKEAAKLNQELIETNFEWIPHK